MKILSAALFSLITLLHTASAAADDDLRQALDDYFTGLYDAEQPGAAILVAKGDNIILHKAYGLANVEHDIPLTTDMHFRIASITKQFTATAALKLHQQGLIDVNEPITKYLPGYPTHGYEIPIKYLASNRSGIPDYVFFEGFMGKDDTQARSLDQLLAYFSAEPLEFAPNELQQYSSSNFVVLGKLIEVMSGQTYEDYLNEVFFKPLGMNSTAYGRYETIMPGRVSGYQLENEQLINAPYLSMTAPHAAGALRSTTMDLYRWQKALLAGDVLPPKLLDLAWSKKVLSDGYVSNYAYGWNVGELDGAKTISHSGGIPGFSTFSVLLPEEDLHVIILSNFPEAVDTNLIHIAGQAIQKVRQKPARPEQKAVHKDLLSSLPGSYEFRNGLSALIERDGNKLTMKFPWENEKHPLYYADDHSVFFSDTWSTFKVLDDNSPRGNIVMEYWNGARIYGKKR